MIATAALALGAGARAAAESGIGGFGDTAIASILAALIAGLVAYATARASRKGQQAAAEAAATAAVAAQTVSSRTDIEKEAFERAKSFYTDTLDRQDTMIAARDTKIIDLEAKTKHLEEQVDHLEDEVEDLRSGRAADQQEIALLKERLAVATTLLEKKYPDE